MDVISETISFTILFPIIFNISFCTWGQVKLRRPFNQVVNSSSPFALYFKSWLKLPLSLSTPRKATPCRANNTKPSMILRKFVLARHCCLSSSLDSCTLTGFGSCNFLIIANLWHWLSLCAQNFSIAFFQFLKPLTMKEESAFEASLDFSAPKYFAQ